jgi:hypothetical protein
VNNDARAIDDGLNSARAKFCNSGADKIDNRARLGNFLRSAELCELTTNNIDNEWPRQFDLT